MNRIQILPPATARLIAAGEVIERPASVLRELIDNSIDAGASEIVVELVEGGLELIRISDNGTGMTREDLELSILPHATSKIRSADDLLTARSLGFRGEALPSIAAVSQLVITSKMVGDIAAHKLTVRHASKAIVQSVAGQVGTIVEVHKLFEDYPARKNFLKRAQTEASQCKQVLIDKALAHPHISFKLHNDEKLTQNLMSTSIKERALAIYPDLPPELMCPLQFSGVKISGTILIALPATFRNDRRFMQIFVNRRRINDAGLLQALDYSFNGFLPAGFHPIAFLFAEIDPSIVDFNIHPAKREARFKDMDNFRRSFIATVQNFLLEVIHTNPEKMTASIEQELQFEKKSAGQYAQSYTGNYSGNYTGANFNGGASFVGEKSQWANLDQLREGLAPLPSDKAPPTSLHYLGTAFKLFLIAEYEGALYLIDQHAAHERVIYDELSDKPVEKQELLVPCIFEPEDEHEEERLEKIFTFLPELGFTLEAAHKEKKSTSYVITASPALLKNDPIQLLKELLKEVDINIKNGQSLTVQTSRLANARALAACRSAIKDGDELDPISAYELLKKIFALPQPRCPHGRPLWIKLTQAELFRLVRRE